MIGLEVATNENPDVILLDIVMSGMDGFEVCQRLKSDKKTNDIPVIFVTGNKRRQREPYSRSGMWRRSFFLQNQLTKASSRLK